MTDPLTVSWSRLRSWEECKQKARLRFLGKRSIAADNRVYFPGTVSDRVMRDWLLSPQGRMRDLVEEYVDRCEREITSSENGGVLRWRDAKDKKNIVEWCQTLADRLQPHLEELVVPFEFDSALRFKTPIKITNLDGELEDVFLIGEMDLRIRKSGSFGIWDLKATENESYWRKTVGQLVFYDVANYCMEGQFATEWGLIQPMCEKQRHVIEVTDEHRQFLTRKIMDYAHSVWLEDYAPKKDSAGCSYCDVKHSCAKYKAEPGTRKVSLLGRTNVSE